MRYMHHSDRANLSGEARVRTGRAKIWPESTRYQTDTIMSRVIFRRAILDFYFSYVQFSSRILIKYFR